jgi:hypothetical protein
MLEEAVLRALEKDPSRRYQTAAEMAEELERVATKIVQAQALIGLIGIPEAPVRPPSDPYKTNELTAENQAIGMSPGPSAAGPHSADDLAGRAAPDKRFIGYHRYDRVAAACILVLIGLAIAGLASGIVPNAFVRSPAPVAQQAASGVTPTANSQAEAPAPPATTMAPSPPALEPTSTPQPAPATLAPAPEATAVQVLEPAPAPTPAPRITAETTPQVGEGGETTTIHFEETDWQGGYRYAPGRTYSGRTATWIYGQATQYNTMRAIFDIDALPQGTASLSIEGMDSETRGKTLIRISVNGVEIYSGPDPLPDDDAPYETGTWATYTWPFEASLLQPGQNEITISNLDQGAFGLPPFFMLDYAELSFQPT